MFNNNSNLSDLEGTNTEIKTYLYSIKELITKLSNELDGVRKNQYAVNEQNKTNNKKISYDLGLIKNELLNYQSNLASQSSKISMLEKEVAILKTPNLTFSNSYDSVEKGSTISEKTSKRNSLAKSEELVENVDVLNYGTGNSNGNVKIEENLNFLFTNSITTAKSVNQIQESFSNFKNEVTEVFNKKDQIIETLLAKNKVLEATNSELKSKIFEYEEEKNKGKFCIHCHQTFIPKFNEDKACVYHPGKLKYYSCRGCGGDEYYTCCMKCSKCSNGCKTGKHIGGV